jgi:hypothetical protein
MFQAAAYYEMAIQTPDRKAKEIMFIAKSALKLGYNRPKSSIEGLFER